MTAIEYTDNLAARVAFKRLTGLTIRLTPYELIEAIDQQSDDLIVVKVQTFQLKESRSSVTMQARGTKLLAFSRPSSDSPWAQMGRALTVWDTDFVPFSHNLYGAGKTFAEWIADREFARMCFRPGTPNFPLDNHARVGAGYTTSKMERYW